MLIYYITWMLYNNNNKKMNINNYKLIRSNKFPIQLSKSPPKSQNKP
jgi:hypothetical protein